MANAINQAGTGWYNDGNVFIYYVYILLYLEIIYT